MRYCKRCVMPDTRPGIKFDEDGVCYLVRLQKKEKRLIGIPEWKN